MERPGGSTPPDASGGGGGARGVSLSNDQQGGRGGGGGEDDDGIDLDADALDRPSQVPASAKRAATSASLVSGWLFNSARETAPPSAGPGPVGCAYGDDIAVAPSSLPRELAGVGGPAVLFPLLQRAQTEAALCWTLRLIARVVRGGGASSVGYMQIGGGYLVLAGLLRSRRALLGSDTVRACFEMAVDRAYHGGDDGANAGKEGGPVDDDNDQDGGDGGSGAGNEDLPWGGADTGLGDDPSKAVEDSHRANGWGWEEDNAFMPRDEMSALLRKAGMEEEEEGHKAGQEGVARRSLSPFVLLTEPYALKHVVLNHQIWGLEDRGLMLDVLQLVHSLVSPHNSKVRIALSGRKRVCRHLIMERSPPPCLLVRFEVPLVSDRWRATRRCL